MKFYFNILLGILLVIFSPVLLTVLSDGVAYVYGCSIDLDKVLCSVDDVLTQYPVAFALEVSRFAFGLFFFVPIVGALLIFIWLMLIFRYALLKAARNK